MNDQSSTPGASSTNDPLSPQKPSLSADALMRRRLMLRGASGGAAALAALQPIGALATGQSTVLICTAGDLKQRQCSVSGVQSAAHSFGPNVDKVWAKGKTKTYWKDASSWPNGCSKNTKVGDVFKGASNPDKTFLQILSSHAGTIEADFVTAYLNGAFLYSSTPSVSKTFPYSKEDVVMLWGKDGDTRARARQLFVGISS